MDMLAKSILEMIGVIIGIGVFGLISCHFYTKWSDRRMDKKG